MARVLSFPVEAASARALRVACLMAVAACLACGSAKAQDRAPQPIDLGGRFLGSGSSASFRMPVSAQPIGPVGQWFGQEAYPAAAMRAGEQGRVIAMLAIDTKGKPASCAVATSSGSAILDSETCAIAMTRMRFTPARNADGNAIVGQYRLPVRWMLSNPVMATPVNMSVQTQIAVATDGTVEACETEPALPPGTPGPCLGWPVGRRIMMPQLRDGKPVKAHVVISMDIVTTLDP